jgi:hypothetical protein
MGIRAANMARYWGVLIGLLLIYSCSGRQTASWQMIGVYGNSHNIMAAGFLNEQVVATGGVGGEMAYSGDGAETWLVTNSMADCRYGMDIISPGLIWSCGGATHVRRSLDRGQTWETLANFGDPRTIRGACHSASFLDENTDWLANSNMFGTTTDGGASWNLRTLPETADKIATIDTFLPGEGYLLDQSGALFHTKDDGQHWTEKSQIELGSLKMAPSAYQLAAMRFSDADHGLVVVSASPFGEEKPVIAFHTSDGGETWASEDVPVLAGPVYLARQDGYLTVITGANQITLLRYEDPLLARFP